MPYKIVRYRRNAKTGQTTKRTIKKGLNLREAQAHCNKASTHGKGWFDAFTYYKK